MTDPDLPEAADSAGGDPFRKLVSRRVAKLRQQRNWTLERLAAASGVSRSMISQIERGQANPTLAVAHRIAQAMGMSLADLVEADEGGARIEVVRARDPSHQFRAEPDCRIRTLSPLHMEKDVEFYQIWLGPGGALRSAPHFRETREFLTIHKGKAQVTSGEQSQALGRGDSAHYRADVAHAIENRGRGELIAYLVVTYAPS